MTTCGVIFRDELHRLHEQHYGQVLRTLSLPDRRCSGGDDPDDGAGLRATPAPLPPTAPQPPGADGTPQAAA